MAGLLAIVMLASGAGLSHAQAAPQPAQIPLRELVGQRLVVALPGAQAPRVLLQRIHERRAAGVILFTRNVRSGGQLRSLTARLQAARPPADPPLLVMIDQEGGLVKRLPGAPSDSPAQLGRIGSAALARREGAATASNLRGAGVNVNLAPVVDVGRRGGNQERLGRSYSRDPNEVARLGGAFARGLAAGHVAACAKHFPGLGAARGDEDFHVNRIDLPLSTLRGTDEAPFGALAGAGVPLVMVSTARYPALDSSPALFSRAIATGELRDRLGFKGVSISDDLDTPAAARLGSPGARALASAHAGIDLLLFAQSYPNAARAEQALIHDAAAGGTSRADLEASAARIAALRESLR